MSNKDLSQIKLEVLDVQTLFLDDTPKDFLDDADLVKVTVQVTNTKDSYFSVQDKMFRLWVMEADLLKSTPEKEVLELVDNYDTIYDMELEVIFEKFESRELFEECDYTNVVAHYDEPQTFTLCFQIIRSWTNSVLVFDDSKKFFLVMNDNAQASSCHRMCYKISLSNESPRELQMPKWIQNIYYWHSKGIISDQEFEKSINYLREQSILPFVMPQTMEISNESSLNAKNLLLKEHQSRLADVVSSNLFVSAMTFYEPRYFDDFSGVLCKQQNNIVTLSGDYTNSDDYFDAVFFKLLLFDGNGDVVQTGITKVQDLVPDELRHFSVSTPHTGKINHCLVVVDSTFKTNE